MCVEIGCRQEGSEKPGAKHRQEVIVQLKRGFDVIADESVGYRSPTTEVVGSVTFGSGNGRVRHLRQGRPAPLGPIYVSRHDHHDQHLHEQKKKEETRVYEVHEKYRGGAYITCRLEAKKK